MLLALSGFAVDELRLCSCVSDKCESPADFSWDAGRVRIGGPSALADTLAAFALQATGVDLVGDVGEEYFVLATKGTDCSSPEKSSLVSDDGVSRVRQNRAEWSAFHVGGPFALCLCRDNGGGEDCWTPSDFSFYVGQLIVSGPLVGEKTFTCMTGDRCSVSVNWVSYQDAFVDEWQASKVFVTEVSGLCLVCSGPRRRPLASVGLGEEGGRSPSALGRCRRAAMKTREC